ncbi:hypothetical protein QF206_01205 [Klugiella sp. YN-L-19]|uniref:AMIN-like domain-containing protein n=1 Tax=Ruicaihuangia caeni TaxID=3042517 RepID=A0AAW6T4M7_9MICO|nr:hypothetical protein [Klugiella sp. YN-L-19]
MTGDRPRKTAERDLTAQGVRAAWGILALAAVMLLGGCTGGPSPSPTSTLTPSASPSEPVAPTPTSPTLSPEPTAAPITPPPPGPSCEADWTTAPQAATQASTARVTDVRVGRHDCFDRLVIDLDRSAPGYEVRYVSAVSEEGSGRMLSLAGSAFLSVVVLAPAYDIETGKRRTSRPIGTRSPTSQGSRCSGRSGGPAASRAGPCSA